MTLYKLNEDKQVTSRLNATMPIDNGGSFYPDKVDEAKRNEYGYYTFVTPPQTESTEYNNLVSSPMVLIDGLYTLTYIYEDIPLAEMKDIKISQLSDDVLSNDRPIVTVPLEDGSTMDIWGGRNDQFDIGDRYELMQEDSIPTLYLKDVYNIVEEIGHLDVKRCYKAITINRHNMIEYQWLKEAEINACVTIEELKLIEWGF